MPILKTIATWIKKLHLQAIGILVLLILALTQMWFNSAKSLQAISALSALVEFRGQAVMTITVLMYGMMAKRLLLLLKKLSETIYQMSICQKLPIIREELFIKILLFP